MAKKKTKKEEVIDFTKPKKINEQQLAKLQSTIKSMEQFTSDIGRIEMQKQNLVKAIDRLSGQINTMRLEFSNEYGTDDIDIHDGTINYPENGEINQKD